MSLTLLLRRTRCAHLSQRTSFYSSYSSAAADNPSERNTRQVGKAKPGGNFALWDRFKKSGSSDASKAPRRSLPFDPNRPKIGLKHVEGSWKDGKRFGRTNEKAGRSFNGKVNNDPARPPPPSIPSEIIDTPTEDLFVHGRLTAGGKLRPVSKYTAPEDPYLISEKTKRLLERGEYEEAVTLVRTAKKGQSVVAWNMLIDAAANIGHLKTAKEYWRELRERRFYPTASTYASLLKACAKSDAPKAIIFAMSLYNSMGFYKSEPNNAPKQPDVPKTEKVDPKKKDRRTERKAGLEPTVRGPSIMHANGMLSVCARHRNVEVLWRVYENLRTEFLRDPKKARKEYRRRTGPETDLIPHPYWSGLPIPDAGTFSTVLRGLADVEDKSGYKPGGYFGMAKKVMEDAIKIQIDNKTYMATKRRHIRDTIDYGVLEAFLTVCKNSAPTEATESAVDGLKVAMEIMGPLVMNKATFEEVYAKSTESTELPGAKALIRPECETPITDPKLIELLDQITAAGSDRKASSQEGKKASKRKNFPDFIPSTRTLELVLTLAERAKLPISVLERIMGQFYVQFSVELDTYNYPALDIFPKKEKRGREERI